MPSMPAPTAPVTVGVDTHLDTHLAAVLDHTGRLDTQAFPALHPRLCRSGDLGRTLWAGGAHRGEGTGTYGAGLTRFVRAYGWRPSR